MGMGKGGDGNKKGSGGGTELHTTVMAPCFYVGIGSTPGETKTGERAGTGKIKIGRKDWVAKTMLAVRG